MSITQMLVNDFSRFPGLIESYLKLPQFTFFQQRHQIYYETDRYVIQTASRLEDIFKTFRLRYRSFVPKTLFGQIGIDLDEYDFLSDHIVILDKKNKKVCGTYRIRCSHYTDSFYSQEEFDLNDFLKEPGVKLELGRACIAPEYRNGAVLNLLWHGIGQYIKVTGAKYLIGCSSIKTICSSEAGQIDRFFEIEGMKGFEYMIRPKEKYRFDLDCEKKIGDIDTLIPPLLKMYVKSGAKIYGKPALDLDFNCIDYLTILNIDKMDSAFKRRYCK